MYVSMIVKCPSRLGLHLYCLHLRFISTSWKKGGAEYDEYCCLERILSTLSHNDSTYSIISLDILYSIVLCILYMYQGLYLIYIYKQTDFQRPPSIVLVFFISRTQLYIFIYLCGHEKTFMHITFILKYMWHEKPTKFCPRIW